MSPSDMWHGGQYPLDYSTAVPKKFSIIDPSDYNDISLDPEVESGTQFTDKWLTYSLSYEDGAERSLV